MTRPRLLLIAALSLVCLLLGLDVWTRMRTTTVITPLAGSGDAANAADATPLDEGTTTLYAHNLILRQGPNFRVYVRWLRGVMLRTRPEVNPSFDDPESFVLEIQKGVVHLELADVSKAFNAAAPAGAALTDVTLEPVGGLLKMHGTAHKILPLPVELTGQLSPMPDYRVRLHVLKIDVLKVPMKGLFGMFHVELGDLIHATNIPGVQVAGNDLIFDAQKLLPPPHIRGQVTTIRVQGQEVEVIYGDSPDDEGKLAQWHNFLRLSGGTVGFGKLTMRQTDLTMIDASQKPWFDLDLVHYQAQLVNGTTRVTPRAGLEIFMPEVDEKTAKANQQAITLDWLKDKNSSVPSGVPVSK